MAKQGDLVVEIGADIAPFVDEMRRASEQAKQAGTSIARSFKDGYKLAAPSESGIIPAGFGPRAGFPGMEGYNIAGGNVSGPEAAAMRAAQLSAEQQRKQMAGQAAVDQQWAELSRQQETKAAEQARKRMAGQAAVDRQWADLSREQETKAIARQNWKNAEDRARMVRESEMAGRAAFMRVLSEDRAETAASRRGSGGGLARGIGQMGFAVQDFASVYSIGGRQATERALMSTMNNVQMLGMALGPTGMAVTAVAGALGSLLIPKLFATGDAVEKTAKNLEEGLQHITRLNASESSLSRSVRSAVSGGSSSVRGSMETAEFELGLAKMEKDRLKREYDTRMDIAVRSGYLVKTPTGGLSDGKDMWGAPLAEAEVARTGLREVHMAIRDIEERERELATIRSAAAHKLDELVKKEAAEAFQKEQANLLQKRLDETNDRAERAYNIKQGHLTPFERVQQQLTEIGDLQGLLGADASVIAGRIVKDFKRNRGGDTANLAVSGGEARTAAGFSDIMKSIRQMSSPETKEQKKQTMLLERMLEQLRSGIRLDPPVREETC